MAKFNIQNYWHPTPKKWRKVGDSILGLGVVVTAVTAITASPWVPILAASLSWVGKTITNFASDEDATNTNNQ